MKDCFPFELIDARELLYVYSPAVDKLNQSIILKITYFLDSIIVPYFLKPN